MEDVVSAALASKVVVQPKETLSIDREKVICTSLSSLVRLLCWELTWTCATHTKKDCPVPFAPVHKGESAPQVTQPSPPEHPC